MTAKLRIDLSLGLIEAEGNEDFLLALYNDFKERVQASARPAAKAMEPAHPTGGDTTKTTKSPSRTASASGGSKAKKKPRDSQSIVKDLDLTKGKSGRLKEFYERYAVKSNLERNLVFIYYMQNELELTGITDDHVYTCYRNVGAKLPGALRQSLLDTSSRNGWIDTSDMDNIRLATPGVNHLEHDLPKASAAE